jgi:hypothetical protein
VAALDRLVSVGVAGKNHGKPFGIYRAKLKRLAADVSYVGLDDHDSVVRADPRPLSGALS